MTKYYFDFLPTKFELATPNNHFCTTGLNHFLLVARPSTPATLRHVQTKFLTKLINQRVAAALFSSRRLKSFGNEKVSSA